MLPIAILSSAPSALLPVKIHPHHRKGSHVESVDGSSSYTAAQIPAGAVQNLFGGLLRSLEQVIGVQSSAAASAAAPSATAASAPASAPATSTPASAASTSSAGAGTMSTQSAITLLQNYLNNLSRNAQANPSQAANPAAANVRVNA